MPTQLSPKIVALSLAIVSAILSIACALLLKLAPEATVSVFGSIFHGIDITKIATPVTLSGVLIGLVVIIILSSIVGWLFALIYNYLEANINKKR